MLWIVHVEPFQRAANGAGYPVPGLNPPTDSQDVADTQLTAVKLPANPLGLAVGRIDHALPSQLSASVPPLELAL